MKVISSEAGSRLFRPSKRKALYKNVPSRAYLPIIEEANQ
jgi:hypothetical protein